MKRESFHVVAGSLATLLFAILWKVENILNQLGNIAKRIVNHFKSAMWFLLGANKGEK